jgi:predicted permease
MQETGFTTDLVPLREDVVGGVSRILWIVFTSVGLVLLVACTNVASLFLARLEVQRRATAIRGALGAGRAHLAGHFLAESVLLTLIGGALGLVLAHQALRVLTLASVPFPRLREVHLDWASVGFVAFLSIVIGALIGLATLRHADTDPRMLAEAGTGRTASPHRHKIRGVLVGTELALSTILLTSAMLLVQSFHRLTAVRPGFDPHGVLTFRVVLPKGAYASFDAVEGFYRELFTRIAALPGVTAVGLTTNLPLTGFDGCSGIRVAEDAALPDSGRLCVPVHLSSPGYFRALGIPVRGALQDWAKTGARGSGAVVSEAFARRVWPGEDPIGKAVRVSHQMGFLPVVGVARDVHGRGLDKPPTEDVYLPLVATAAIPVTGGPPRYLTFVVRASTRTAEQLVPLVRRTVADLDTQVPVTEVRAMEHIMARSIAPISSSMLLLNIASGMALLLSVVGTYGLLSYIVAARHAEIAIRAALGAPASRVAQFVVLQAVRLASAAVAFGVVGTLLLTRLLRTLLFGVSPSDPLTLSAVSVFVVMLAAAASYAPVRRAMRIDPAEVLRHG